jgi:hypothetical protein
MLYKEEEDEVSLLFVNDCFYDKRNAEVDFIDKHYLESVYKIQLSRYPNSQKGHLKKI